MKVLTKDDMLVETDHIEMQIKGGAVFIHPTDTIYGIGCDATNDSAVHKIREIKDRCDRPFSVIAPSKGWIKENCEVSKEAEEWIGKLPGPYTLILKLKNNDAISKEVNKGFDSVGVRIPDHWISKVAEDLNVPIVTTSANKTGENFMTSVEDLHHDIKANVDFVVYEGEKKGKPSTIVHLEGDEVRVKER